MNKQENNQKCPIYIIACPFDGNGLFSIFLVCLTHIFYAFKNGYIPIVDLKHYKNQYFKEGRIFKDNVWEYFFKQPAEYCLNDIDENTNIIISKGIMNISCFQEINNAIQKTLKGENYTDFEEYFNKIEFSDEIKTFLIEGNNNITKGESEILGIICRGTDYTSLRPDKHNIQPEINDVIKKAKELLKRFKYKKIYLATEDKNIYEKFQKEFGDILLNNIQYKYSYNSNLEGKILSSINVERKNHNYNLAREYLLSIYILSKCKYLIGGMTSAIYGLWFISKGFKNQTYISFWDIGRHHNSNIIKGGKFLRPLIFFKNLLKEKVQKILYKNRAIGFDKY